MRRRLSYANVTATLALVFAMSGGALAANHYLITSTKQINPSVLKKLTGKAGATGATGATGLQGAAGKEGSPGKEGAKGETGKEGKEATIPALTWTPLPLEHGWTEYEGGEYGVPRYAKDADGFVHFTGAISGSAKTGSAFATLPTGFRPGSEFIWLRAPATDGSAHPELVDIQIEATGLMEAENGAGANDAFVSLEGVTFYAGG
jgi:hypothetical protein